MKKNVFYFSIICALFFLNLDVAAQNHPYSYTQSKPQSAAEKQEEKNDYYFEKMNLGKLGLGRRAFDYAMLGYNVLINKGKLKNDDILSIADMSLPSGKKRLFVLDMKQEKVLFVTYVAHGKNTGLDKALYFSNEPESFKSSVGFYITLGTYNGSHGYSLQLAGQEIGFNSNARERDIVMHSASYVGESVVKSQGYVGRSLGCPAVAPEIYKPIIETIKGGSCLFIYGNDNSYIKNSKFLKRKVTLEPSPVNNANELDN